MKKQIPMHCSLCIIICEDMPPLWLIKKENSIATGFSPFSPILHIHTALAQTYNTIYNMHYSPMIMDQGRYVGIGIGVGIKQKNPLSKDKGFFKNKIKTGGGLLSRFRSTIGAGGLNFCVRNGNRCAPPLKPP